MDADSGMMLATLGEAQQILLTTPSALSDGAGADRGDLEQLLKTVSGLADQADALMASMLEGEAPDDLLEVAEALVEFFTDAEERVAATLKLD